MRTTLIAVALAAAVLSAAFSARAEQINPHDFDVQLRGGLPLPPPPLPSCTSDPDGGQTCTVSLQGASRGDLGGDVTQRSTGRSGTFGASCDLAFGGSATARIPPGVFALQVIAPFRRRHAELLVPRRPRRVDAGGQARRPGDRRLERRANVALSGTFAVAVAAGTGEFAGLVGGGVFQESVEYPIASALSLAAGALPVPLGVPIASLVRSPLAAAAETSRLALQLRKGRPRALVVSPRSSVSRAGTEALRLVSAPRASCTATARGRDRRVDLGRAADVDGDGLVVFPGALAQKLGPGAWTLSAVCAYRVGKASGTARTSSTVRIA